MRQRKKTNAPRDLLREAARLTAELRQPLTATSNYVAVARMQLISSEPEESGEGMSNLALASDQIYRTGEIVGRLSSAIRDLLYELERAQ